MTYSERLHVPLRWWVQGTMLVASVWLAALVLPVGYAWVVTAVALALMVAGFLAYGSARIVVAGGRLQAGGARIDGQFLGTVQALDAEAAWRVAGPEADARAYLLLRPYLKQAVKVEILDAADPTPYWLLGTRHPHELARAVRTLTEPSSVHDR